MRQNTHHNRPRLQRPAHETRTAAQEGSAARVVTHYAEQHSQTLDVLGEFAAGNEQATYRSESGPRVVMRRPDEGADERRSARNKLGAIYALVGLVLFLGWLSDRRGATAQPADGPAAVVVGEHVFLPATAEPAVAVAQVDAALPSRLWQGFSPTVLYWEPLITRWADHYGVDPNQAAIIMQVESCGDPQAVSRAGAQGLFQVMPFHFAAGENPLDPDTNAMRGLAFFAEVLAKTGNDVGRAFAAYNGGWNGTAGGWDTWKPETQRYYVYTTGMMADIAQNDGQAEALGQWLGAGGFALCNQAAARLVSYGDD